MGQRLPERHPAPTEDATRALTDLREKVDGVPGYRDPRYSGQFTATAIVHRDEVLALIDDAIAAQKGADE